MLPPPKIEKRWTCIAHYEATTLTAQLSSYFNEPGVYFPVFLFPGVSQAFQEVRRRTAISAKSWEARSDPHQQLPCADPAEPDHLARIERRCAILPPSGSSGSTCSSWSIRRTELLKLPFVAGTGQPFKCKHSEAIHGLIAAKRERRPLAFDDSLRLCPPNKRSAATGLVVIENNFEVSEVAIANYAASIGADVRDRRSDRPPGDTKPPATASNMVQRPIEPGAQSIRRKITRSCKGHRLHAVRVRDFLHNRPPLWLNLTKHHSVHSCP